MGSSIPESSRGRSSSFVEIASVFLQAGALPFGSILSATDIRSVFEKHDGMFGGSVYTTATVLWAFLGQVLQDGKMAACQAAVSSISSFQLLRRLAVPSPDTGDYCRARAKLKEDALHELATTVSQGAEDQAEDAWLFHSRHAKLIDGLTFVMPDTPKNQAAYPQQKGQAAGCGFPIARCVAVISLATACVMDLAIGAYSGKLTGENALLRQLLGCFKPRDIAVMDRYYCSYMMIALLLNQQVDVCCTKHHARKKSDFRRGKRLGKYDHLIIWQRPQRPDWMDEATYETIPKELVLREIRYSVTEPGFRTKRLTVITSLTDPCQHSKESIAELYRFRWNVELDIRSIKSNLNLDRVRCKSPEMVRRELWTTLLAYNLIRTTAASAAAVHQCEPRQISFTSTCQAIAANWMVISSPFTIADIVHQITQTILKQIQACRVADRPGRIEPRKVKMRPKRYHYMTKPRRVLQALIREGKLEQ